MIPSLSTPDVLARHEAARLAAIMDRLHAGSPLFNAHGLERPSCYAMDGEEHADECVRRQPDCPPSHEDE